MKNPIKCLLLVSLSLAAAPVLADTPIHQSHALAPDAELSVSNVAGAVIVHTWNKHQVDITGSLGRNAKLKISGDANDLEIKVKGPDDSGWSSDNDMGPTTLTLMVPKSVNLDLDVVSATIKADGLAGGTFEADSVSGNVTVNAQSPDVEIQSVSGDVKLTGSADKVEVTSVSGDMHIAHATHEAATQSVSGDIHLTGGPFKEASMESVSGDIYLDGSLTDDAEAKLHSMSGDIHLTLTRKPQAELHATTFSGDIQSPWGKVNEPTYGPGSSLDTRIGDGDGSITLKTFSGDVVIRQGH